MTNFKRCVLLLVFATSLAPGLSCADDSEPAKGPTQDEMEQVATDLCEKELACGFTPAEVTVEDCIENQLGAYQVSPECVAVYDFDECRATQTCEELERLEQLNMGDCLDEREKAFDVQCVP